MAIQACDGRTDRRTDRHFWRFTHSSLVWSLWLGVFPGIMV